MFNKNILISIFLIIILLGTISAFDFDNSKTFEKVGNLKYGQINLKNAFGFGNSLATYELTDNTDYCDINCSAEGRVKINSPRKLFDDLIVEDLSGKKTNIKELKIYILEREDYSITIPAVPENNTEAYEENRYRNVWKEYDGRVLEKGNYYWRIEGKKNSDESIDWIATAFGKQLREWAVWKSFYQSDCTQWGLGTYNNVICDGENLTLYLYPSIVRYEYDNDGFTNESHTTFGTAQVFSQAFTLGTTGADVSHSPINISLRIFRISAGTMNVSIRRTEGGGNETPIGADFCSGTFDTTPVTTNQSYGQWVNISISGCPELNTSTQYALLLSSGSANTGIKLENPAGYTGGNMSYSADYAKTWAVQSYNAMFEVWASGTSLYSTNGTYTSYVMNANNSAMWENLTWGEFSNTNTNITLQTRTSNDNTTWTAWSGNWSNPSGIINSSANYLQYKVEFGTTNQSRTPYLNWVNISHTAIPTITVVSPANTSYTTSTIYFNATANDDIVNWIVNWNGTNATLPTINSSLEVEDGSHNLIFYGQNTLGKWGYNNSISFAVDSTLPNISVISGINLDYFVVGSNMTINWSVNDTNLDSCRFIYNTTWTTVTCSENTTIISNITDYSNRNITFEATDTFGNVASKYFSWNYTIFQNSLSYNEVTTEGASETFLLNFTKVSTAQISTIDLIYNGTTYSSTYQVQGDNVIASREITIPNYDAVYNSTFYFSILTTSSNRINTSNYNQTINILSVDDCTAYSTLVYNFSIFDEESKSILPNSTIDIQLNLYNEANNILILNFSQTYDKVNISRICFDNSLLTTVNYSANLVVKYRGNSTLYSTEYYNILNDIITNTTVPNHIKLYDLKKADTTEFQLTFRDNSSILSQGTIVEVYRQYVEDNDFKVVERPITDSNGQTVLHLVRNDVIYNFVMKDANKNIIATFNRVIAFCQDYTIGDCQIKLTAEGTAEDFYDYTSDLAISYSSSYSNVSDQISFEFLSNNGEPKDVNIKVNRGSDFGNRSVCDESLTSASGVINCNTSSVSSTDKYLYLDIYVDNQLKASKVIDLEYDSFNWGINGSLFAFLLILVMILIFNEDKQLLIVGIIFGWIICISLGFISGAIIGVGASTLWLIVTGIVIIWKLKGEEYG